MSLHFLRPGDCIGIAAFSSAFDKAAFLAGTDCLRTLGYDVYYRPDIFSDYRGFAGTDDRRLEEFHALVKDPVVKAILFARGGWGAQRIVSRLDLALLAASSKLLVGYSDLTTLHLYLYHHFSRPFFYGPVVAKDLHGGVATSACHSLQACLQGTIFKTPVELPMTECLAPGEAEAPIVGGCLSLIVTSSGTPYGLPFRDTILFIEDINEKPYAIDRMLTHLREAGRLSGIRGLICGQFKNCGDPQQLKDIILDHFKDYRIPILWNAPYGHGDHMHCLPLGIPATLCTSPTAKLSFSPV